MKKNITVFAAILTPFTLFALPNYDPFADATASGGTAHAVGIWLSQPDAGGNGGTGQKDATGGQWYHAGTATVAAPAVVGGGSLQYAGLPPASGNKVLI